MAAPVAGYIQTPTDAGNTGKKVRTQSRVVGADTVHDHFVVVANQHSTTGIYYYHSGTLSIPTAAHNGTTTGHFWLVNVAGSTIKGCLRGIKVLLNTVLMSAADLTICRQLCALITFTGTPSGATITPAKRSSTDPAAQMTLRTASTGMSVTLGAPFRAELPPLVSGTAGVGYQPTVVAVERETDVDERMEFRTGEGMVFYSADASTTANRRVVTDLINEEFE
jgi:hypothetical protein